MVVRFSCVCPVFDNQFCHNIVKVVCRSTATLTMLWLNSSSITGQTYEKLTDVKILQLSVWWPGLWMAARLELTVLWYRPLCFCHVSYVNTYLSVEATPRLLRASFVGGYEYSYGSYQDKNISHHIWINQNCYSSSYFINDYYVLCFHFQSTRQENRCSFSNHALWFVPWKRITFTGIQCMQSAVRLICAIKELIID